MENSHPDSIINRRTLVTLIILLIVVQGAILAYLWTLEQPSSDPLPPSSPTPLPTPTSTHASSPPTDAPPAPTSEPTEFVVGPLVPATDCTGLARAFDPERALDHLARLASADMAGRQPGTPGGYAAGDYIAARFAEYGLQPAGEDASYFQSFTLPYGRIAALPTLSITPPPGETLTHTYSYRIDYIAFTGNYIGAGSGAGPVIWLNRCQHEDYAGLDATGKIVMCRYDRDIQIYRQAIEHQVGGLLLLDRETEPPFRRGGYRETPWTPYTIPAYRISEAVARDLLVGTGYTLDDLSLRFSATPLSTTVQMAVEVEGQTEIPGRNVLGLLPGADPAHVDEIVIVGAHYDHLGREPDGEVMYGANDNGSGVALMLEIARLWQEQGFRPSRSLLFAAWDGEEQGLLGSQQYVHSPTLPLTQTVAMLNLDMVAAGDHLRIDGEGPLVAQLEASGLAYGISATTTFEGRSDHIPFHLARIPAATLIYWPDPHYHTPEDTIATVDPAKLKAVGVLSTHALAALAQSHVELEQAVERLRASILTGDRPAFLDGLDPTDPNLRAAQVSWFDNLWSRELTQVSIQPGPARVGAGVATVPLQTTYRWADTTRREPSASYEARFIQRDGVWTFAGPDLDTLSGDVVTVARFPSAPVSARQLLSATQPAYLAIAAELGLTPVPGTRIDYYPNAATMRAVVRPAADQEANWLVPSAGLTEIVSGHPITPALVNLALNQMGLPPSTSEGVWLREGLARYFQDGVARSYLPTLAATTTFTPLLDFLPLKELPASQASVLRAQAWSAVTHLLEEYGSEGLRDLCRAWGLSNDGSTAFRAGLGLSPAQFQADWYARRVEPLQAIDRAIQDNIAARARAVLAGDEAGLLATLSPTDPTLRTKEQRWLADLTGQPLITYSVTGEIVGWNQHTQDENGNGTIVALDVETVISGQIPSRVSYDARFVRQEGDWLYAGADWDELTGPHVRLQYQGHDPAWAGRMLHLTEEAYTQITADLGLGSSDQRPPTAHQIKLYDDDGLFRISIPLRRQVTSWTGPGEAIRILLSGQDDERAIQSRIASELTRQTLYAQGLERNWLSEGVAAFEMDRARPLGELWGAGRRMPILQEAVRQQAELPLDDLALFPFDSPSSEQQALAAAQSWSLVDFVVRQHGLDGLRRLIAQADLSDDPAAHLGAALDVEPEEFLAAWREHVRTAGVPSKALRLAQRFNPDRALAHVTTLASPAFGGREAGDPGADQAAAYIAAQFAELGLASIIIQPHTPPMTATQPSTTSVEPIPAHPAGQITGTVPITQPHPSYLQWFPISHTHVVSLPTLALLNPDGTDHRRFTYRQDFIEAIGDGSARGELVWVHTPDLAGLDFGGAVALEQDVEDITARAAQLQAHGAGGMIIATELEPQDFQERQLYPTAGTEITIPVFLITQAAFDGLLDELGLTFRDLSFAPPALPLGVQVAQTLVRAPLTTTLTANVLGFLPGSDPDLADEVIIVGAHYDHIGQSPDGFYFPGANHNASGVAALLEMAHVWQMAGYRPARSLLFAAWGAEELGSLGVTHYLTHPILPLTRTVGVVALDGIGNGRGFRLQYYGTPSNDLPMIHAITAGTAELNRRAWHKVDSGAGWQTRFGERGLPTTLLIWDQAERDFYAPTDTAAAIDPDRLAFSGQILTLAVSWLAGE